MGVKVFRNLKSVQGLMPDYNDQTNLSKPGCILNFCGNLRDLLKITSV